MIQLSAVETAILTLLHLGLDEKAQFADVSWTKLSDKQWRAVYYKSAEQGVMFVAYDGVLKLPADCQPDETVRLNWKLKISIQEEEDYAKHCHISGKLREFGALHGIRVTLLKGVGLSPLYPKPGHRKVGDIDLFTDSLDTAKLTDKEANARMEKLLLAEGATYHDNNARHDEGATEVGFEFRGITLENHHVLATLGPKKKVRTVEDNFRRLLQQSPLTIGSDEVLVPSPAFNRVYLPYHTATHFVGRGLALHHFCEWYCFLKKYGHEVPNEGFTTVFCSFINAMTYLCVRYMNLQGIELTATAHEQKVADRLMVEALHAPYLSGKSKISVIFNKIRHFFYARQNARVSIDCTNLFKSFFYGIKSNIIQGRIFRS